MAGQTLTSSLVVRLIDQVTGPARAASKSLLGLNNAARGNFGDRLSGAMERNREALDRVRGQVVDAVASMYLLKQGLSAPINAATKFQSQLEDIAQKSGLTGKGLADLGADAKRLSRLTNQSLSEMTGAIDFLVGMGADVEDAISMGDPIGKAATAYRASSEDLAKAAFAVSDNLKVPVEDVAKALDIMAQAGKEGGFELKDIAGEFPAITAAAQAMGMTGTKAVADLTAALEVARKGTASGAEAANNMANFMQKIVSKDTIKNMKKFGVNVPKEMAKAAKAGVSPIEHMLGIIDKITDGGQADKIAAIFGDKQVVEFIRPMLQNMKEYRRIRKEAMDAQGVVEKDFATRMQTSEERSKRLRNSIELLNVSIGNALLPSVTRIVDKLGVFAAKLEKLTEAHPDLVRNVIGATAAIVGFRAAVVSLKWLGLIGRGGVLSILSLGFNTLGRAIIGATTAARSATALQSALAAMSGARYSGLAKTVDALKAMALAVPGISGVASALGAVSGALAAISLPAWGLIAVGVGLVAAAGAMLYRNWDRVSSVVSGVARALGERLQPILDHFAPALEPVKAGVNLLGDAFKWAGEQLSWVGDLLGSVFKQDSMSEADQAKLEQRAYEITNRLIAAFKDGAKALYDVGADMIQSLWDGMLSRVDALIEWVKTIPSRITAAIGRIDLSNITTLGGILGGGDEPAPSSSGGEQSSGHRKSGGPVAKGGSYIVGDGGEEEIFTPKTGGTITPVSKTGNPINVKIGALHFHGIANEHDFARKVEKVMQDAMRQAARGLHADMAAR